LLNGWYRSIITKFGKDKIFYDDEYYSKYYSNGKKSYFEFKKLGDKYFIGIYEKSSFHSKVEICSKVNKRIYVFMDKYRMRECNFFREVFDKFSKRELLK